MAFTIFYSWQSDISNKINRNFIEEALKKAIKKIGQEITVQEALRDEEIKLDKDTKDVPGIPPIVDVIFEKISSCGIFVPDLTFIGKTKEERLIPNPNVLVEYGWALKEVTHSRIIPVMNTAFGEPSWETLPFDMRHLRHPLTYHLKEDASSEERSKIKSSLADELAGAIKLIIKKNLIQAAKKEEYREIPSTTKPSTFLKPDESFIDTGRFRTGSNKLYVPDTQHLFLRLIPSVPLNSIQSSKQAYDLVQSGGLRPMSEGDGGFSFGRNKYGSYSFYAEDGQIQGFTQMFRTGELWGIDADAIEGKRLMERANVSFGFFPCLSLEHTFLYTLTNYLKFASDTLHLQLPLRFIAGATDVEGYRMTSPPGMHFIGDQFSGNVVDEHIIYEGVIKSYDVKVTEVLRPFFDYVWEECGLDRPDKEVIG